tara:strand:+ start:7624 stop:8970 length:1347 start_codon:yes stop_codon:yes gene_type:complete
MPSLTQLLGASPTITTNMFGFPQWLGGKGSSNAWYGTPPTPPIPESIVRAYNVTTTFATESYTARETAELVNTMGVARTDGVGSNSNGEPNPGHGVTAQGVVISRENDGGVFKIPNEKVFFERTSYANVLDTSFKELKPDIPAIEAPDEPPFLPPVMRLRTDVGGDPKPSGIIVYNGRFWVLGEDKGYWESTIPTSTGKMIVEAGAFVVLSADAWSYKTEAGQEIRDDLTYEWVIDGTVVSTERGLRMFDIWSQGHAKPGTGIFRLSNDPFSPKSYDITLKVTNKVGTSVSQIGIIVLGGEDSSGNYIDTEDFIPYQDRTGFYMNFYDSTRISAPYTGTPVGDEGLFEVVVTDELLYYPNQTANLLPYTGPPQFNLSTNGTTDLGSFVRDQDGVYWYWSGIPAIQTTYSTGGGNYAIATKGAGKGTGVGGGDSFWWNEGSDATNYNLW